MRFSLYLNKSLSRVVSLTCFSYPGFHTGFFVWGEGGNAWRTKCAGKFC